MKPRARIRGTSRSRLRDNNITDKIINYETFLLISNYFRFKLSYYFFGKINKRIDAIYEILIP